MTPEERAAALLNGVCAHYALSNGNDCQDCLAAAIGKAEIDAIQDEIDAYRPWGEAIRDSFGAGIRAVLESMELRLRIRQRAAAAPKGGAR